MNCPGHVQIFKQGSRSYRDLPLRMAEFVAVIVMNPSGITRFNAFVALHKMTHISSVQKNKF